MLEKIDLSLETSKKEYKRWMPELQNHLYVIQKATWDAGLPVMIVFEGWDAAGKGTSIQNLTSRLDPRGFKLHPIRAARTYEKKRPWLWRFWLTIPGKGEWAIFDRSWYGRVLVERVEGLVPESEWRRAYRDIADFERNLADAGYIFVKFFLHISREEQRRRFEKLSKDPLNAWHVQPEDWEHHHRYDDWLLAYEEMFERTETEWAPWTIVEATDRRHTQVKIYRSLISILEERLAALGASPDPALWKIPATELEVAALEAEEEAETLESEEELAVADPPEASKKGKAKKAKKGEEREPSAVEEAGLPAEPALDAPPESAVNQGGEHA